MDINYKIGEELIDLETGEKIKIKDVCDYGYEVCVENNKWMSYTVTKQYLNKCILLRASKHFDMDITFEELVRYNPTCQIEMNSTRHFETFDGISIYVSHPNKTDKFTMELGIDETGIMYEGDYGGLDEYKEIKLKDGLRILYLYGQLINTKSDLECLLCSSDIEENSIFVNIK